jgi:hypothetical protein
MYPQILAELIEKTLACYNQIDKTPAYIVASHRLDKTELKILKIYTVASMIALLIPSGNIIKSLRILYASA